MIVELDPEAWAHFKVSFDVRWARVGDPYAELAGAIVRPKPREPIKPPVPFAVGDIVRTIKGAAFKGRVLSIYHLPPPADLRYVEAWRADVYAEAPDFAGTLHVYPATQLIGVGR